ncbi:cupredoxin domain-containing protein [uncultured Jatrophihabitans sp.]|uniref:cupredoxin domain-containing protein n=1 Tax=uncultured Jatrophihabitans sp. TaxID=1610747 RepID=UPI0035CB0E42
MRAIRTRLAAGVVALALVVGAASGCSNTKSAAQRQPNSGSGTATMVDGAQQIVVVTGADLRFHPATLIVHPGKVRIILQNRTSTGSGPPHNLQVTGLPGAAVPLTPAGDVASVTFTAGKPGRYDFVCTIHVQQGQTGTLVVEPGSASGSGAAVGSGSAAGA